MNLFNIKTILPLFNARVTFLTAVLLTLPTNLCRITSIFSIYFIICFNTGPMKRKLFISQLTLLLAGFFSVQAQKVDFHARNGMTEKGRNYTSFTPVYTDKNADVFTANKGFEQHPEVGKLYAETPCENCYELIGDRTEKSKTFIKRGNSAGGGHDIYRQTSTHSMHYKDVIGNWRTIKTTLEPTASKGVYAALEQPVPVNVNTVSHFTSLGKSGEQFSFNNDLELVYQHADGIEESLGAADWSHHTAGDDGIYVTNAWPGIDMEVYVIRGGIKTNFFINHAMPEYAGGKLLVRDHMKMDAGLKLFSEGKSSVAANLAITDKNGNPVYLISEPTACEKKKVKQTLKMLEYYVHGNNVDIALPGDFLNRPASAYPVVIDPLVSTSTVTPVTGSTYSANWTVPCIYNNAATVPANCTVTDIQWSFNYVTSGGAWLDEGAVDFRLGACRSPTGATGIGGYYWFCNLIGAGTCTGSNISIYTDISSCVPPPQCASYNLNMTMDFYQDYLTTAPCATTYVSGATPLTITVIGHTVEINPVVVSGASTICAGQSTTLSTSATYGVTPYTFTWNPGSLSGSPVTVSPAATTTYTATVTDACGITATATTTITVNPAPPITGTTSVCVGGTTTLSNTTGGGTWSSGTTSVATISSTGVVYGVSVGSTVITYTTPSGCTATTTVNVNLLSPITGTASACVNASSTLNDAFAGGSWSSNNTGIATVDPTSGVVTGVSAGVATITYATGSGCTTTIDFTVNPIPAAIVGPSSVCQGSTISLSDVTTPGTWSSSSGTIATISGGLTGGAGPGTATITYTLGTGCYITKSITVSPIYSSSFSVTICPGTSYSFAGTSYSASGNYPHTFTTVSGCDSIVTLQLTVSPPINITVYDSICAGGSFLFAGTYYTTSGSYSHIFTSVNGCDSNVTMNLFVKPLPPAPVTALVDICQNQSAVAPLTAIGTNLQWYTVPSGGVATTIAPTPSTGTAGSTIWYVSQVVNGCEGPRAPLGVVVHDRPNFTIVPGKPYECQYDTISLHYSGASFPGETFIWTIPSYASVTGGSLTDSSIVVRFDTSLGSNSVSLTIGDGYAPCNSTVAYNVPVYLTAPPAAFSTNAYACTDDTVLVALTLSSPGINDYLWNFDGAQVVTASSNHGGPYKISWHTPGVYVVTMDAVTNPNCPVTTVKDTVRVGDKPDARIAPYSVVGGKAVPCTGDSIIFSPLNFNESYLYHWAPEHYFTEDNSRSRVYGVVDQAGYIKLTVATPFGCKATDSLLVNAQPCCLISFPTAFTPNGDGKNDVFRPIMDGHRKIHFFRIENRWGQVIYESRQESAGTWDGTFSGEPQDMGVYFYYVTYDCGGETQTMKGEVTLIR